MKRALISAVVVAVIVGGVVLVVSSTGGGGNPTYRIQFDNAFGLVTGADFKVAGVKAGTIKSIDLDQRSLHAVVTIEVTQPGFGSFHPDAFCQSRPQSLIGEYFISCDPGHTGAALRAGATIPVSRTQSTIPADLLQNVMRMPYRQRLSLIIGELGAAAAGRSGDLQAALQRAVPALTETDNLLAVLGNDSQTLQQLTANSNAVITALANNSRQVQRFVVEANRAASATATQQANLSSSLHKLPGFLTQLRPAMQKLGAATVANQPVLTNLGAAAGQLDRLFTDLPKFSKGSVPAIRSLGQASVTGRSAVIAATPTIAHLNQFAQPTPELAQNLSIVLQHIDNRAYAVEPNPRSPGGKGYTGLEALLQFAFNLAAATNTYGPFGHQLAVDAFVSAMCTPYATPGTIASNLKLFGPAYRSCYAWLGPNQPGVNVPDSSNPGACVPDPGGAPPGQRGPAATACKLAAADTTSRRARTKRARTPKRAARPAVPVSTGAPAPSGGSPGSSGSSGAGASSGAAASNPVAAATGAVTAAAAGAASSTTAPVSGAIQKLLNYLIAP